MKKPPLGATPGTRYALDEGAARLGVTHYEGHVILDFSRSIKWAGLAPEQAMELARAIMQHAGEAAKTARTQ